MNLIKYTSANLKSSNNSKVGKEFISIQHRGTICFSKAIVEKLSLTENSTIAFYSDDKNKDEWYLSIDPEGLHVYIRSSSTIVQNRQLAEKICESFNWTSPKPMRLKLAPEKTETEEHGTLYGLIGPI